VKLAGIAGGVGLYREEVEAVARAGHQVAMVDLAGDRRDDPAPVPLSWAFLADETRAGFDALGLDGAVVWGTSFGSMIALALAARHPSRVAGLVLSLPPDPSYRPRPWMALYRWARRRTDSDLAIRLTFLAGFGALTAWEGIWPTALRRGPRLARASLEARTPARTVRQKIDLLWREEPGLPAPGTPTAIVAAGWDPVAPRRGAERWSARIPGSTLHVVPRAGHAAPASRPRAYAGAVIRAVREVSGARWDPGGSTSSR
jgi:pimeloyl-ACP methyl ester carboxylesterase